MKSIFNKSVKGASHIVSGKQCQDYSISYEENGITIVVVCDGHGGSTYFRSDIGSRLAAEITLDQLKGFANCIPSDIFVKKEFAITAKPKRNPFIDSDGKRVRYEDLSEDQQKYARQAQSYIEAEGQCKEQQACIEGLLSNVYEEWKRQIRSDEKANPLSKKEKSILDGQGIEKAYGCTLLAFLKTPTYWLSFHIGDGKILVCDSTLSWTLPVPEDCSCFLNYTTSLCDSSPLGEFRYAFNGNGNNPLAVMLCSDGVDGSLRSEDNLQDFYEQIIGLFLDGDDVEEELSSYLPTLSENGNRDDISISGYVDLSNIDVENLRRNMEIKKKNREIKSNYKARKLEIEAIKEKIDNLKIKYESQKDLRFEKQTELESIRHNIEAKENELAKIEITVLSTKKEIENLENTLVAKNKDFEEWKFIIKNEMADSEAELTNSIKEEEESSRNYTNW